MITGNDEFLELQEAADALGVHFQTAYRWVRSGRLPAHLIGSRYLVSRDCLETLETGRKTPVAPAARTDRHSEQR